MSEKQWSVYAHTNKKNGKMYVGITSQKLNKRFCGGHGYRGCRTFYRAIQKYGWDNFDHFLVLKNVSLEEASYVEKHLIKVFHLQDKRFGYNISEGGHDNKTLSEEGLQSLHDHFFGGKSPVARPVVLFDGKTGKRLQEFSCMKDCANHIGCNMATLSEHCASKKGTVKGYVCHYASDVEGVEILPEEMRYLPRQNGKPTKSVNQYDLDGKFLKTYPSIIDASKETGIFHSQITAVAKKKRLSCGGFQWRYFSGDTFDISPVRKRGEITRGENHYHARKILQIDRNTGETIREFGSIVDAVRTVPFCTNFKINSAIRGNRETCGGFVWRYKE